MHFSYANFSHVFQELGQLSGKEIDRIRTLYNTVAAELGFSEYFMALVHQIKTC